MPMKICRRFSCRSAANSSAPRRTPINASRNEVIPVKRVGEPFHQWVLMVLRIRCGQFESFVHVTKDLFAPSWRPHQCVCLPQKNVAT